MPSCRSARSFRHGDIVVVAAKLLPDDDYRRSQSDGARLTRPTILCLYLKDSWIFVRYMSSPPSRHECLVVDDVHVRRMLLSLVLPEVSRPPTHDACVPDSPDPRADVASIEPHEVFEHLRSQGRCGSRRNRFEWFSADPYADAYDSGHQQPVLSAADPKTHKTRMHLDLESHEVEAESAAWKALRHPLRPPARTRLRLLGPS